MDNDNEEITRSGSPSPLSVICIRVSNIYSSVITLCLADISLKDLPKIHVATNNQVP